MTAAGALPSARAPTARPAPAARRRRPAAARSPRPAARTRAPPRRVPATPPRVPPVVRRPRVTRTSTTMPAFPHPPCPCVLASADDCAARPGSCRKPPGALYVESGEEWTLPSPRSRNDRFRILLGPGAPPACLTDGDLADTPRARAAVAARAG